MARGQLSAPVRGVEIIWLAELDNRRTVVVRTRDGLGRQLDSGIVGAVTSTVRGLNTQVDLAEPDAPSGSFSCPVDVGTSQIRKEVVKLR